MPWRIHVRAVEERVRVRSRLDAVVAGRAAVRADTSAPQAGEGRRELVRLHVVDQVAGLDDGARPKLVDGDHGRVEHLGGKRLLRAKRGREGVAETVEPLDACRRLLVEDVSVRDL